MSGRLGERIGRLLTNMMRTYFRPTVIATIAPTVPSLEPGWKPPLVAALVIYNGRHSDGGRAADDPTRRDALGGRLQHPTRRRSIAGQVQEQGQGDRHGGHQPRQEARRLELLPDREVNGPKVQVDLQAGRHQPRRQPRPSLYSDYKGGRDARRVRMDFDGKFD